YEMYTAGNAVAYLDHKGLFKTSKLPSHHNIVGPITFSTKVDMPIWINKIKESSKPCVLVTMGSSGDLDYLTTIIDSLVELPINIIVATMGKMLLNYSHDNLYCVDYLPIEDIAPLCSMFLTNGGSPMSYIGLRAGVPTIGFPVNLDQATSFTAIANNKLGIRMRSSELKKGKIQSAVTEILNDEEYKANCEKIAIEMQGYSTLVNIEKIVSGLLKKSNV
ncbi:MAG: hypothetical protein HOI70_12890, partial [Opitutae bacterium]|nr:hypothetical protein [Opitutae bacterium]